MSKIVAVANKKGGAGKSTLAINLSAAAANANILTTVIDLDPDQQAASKWRDSRASQTPIVLPAVYSRLPQTIAEVSRNGTELILLDTPALADAIISAAIAVADLVLTPCRTTGQDIQYLTSTIDLVAARQKPVAIVLNSVESRLAETEQASELIEKLGVAVAPHHLSKAVAYHRAITAGLGVTELEPTGKASQEILSLLAWISRLLYLSTDGEVDHSQPPSVA
jgi:chromosome partitioning protein